MMRPALLAALFLATTACAQRAPAPASNTVGGGYSANAVDASYTEAQMQRGEVDLWVAPPMYFHDAALYGVYRGPRPNDPYAYSSRSSQSSGSFSKLSRRSPSETVMVTLFAITPQGEQEVFGETPYQIVETEFLSPKPARPDPAPAPKPTAEVVAQGVTTQHIHVHLPGEALTQAPVPDEAPVYVPPQHGQRVGQRVGYWEVEQLERDLIFACVILSEAVRDEEGEQSWTYRGEIWIKDVKTGEIFKHSDPELEPSSWQLHPGPVPQVEVVMADKKGWPRRVDLLDLNALAARTLTVRSKQNVVPK